MAQKIRDRLLKALMAHLRANLVEHPTSTPELPLYEPGGFRLRYHRFRDADQDEWPCISLRYVARDYPGVQTAASPSAAVLSVAEEILEISIDLICDARLPSEDSQADATGLATLEGYLDACLETFFVEGEQPTTLDGLLHDLRHDGDAAGDDLELSTPDSARLAERLTLVYRARTEFPIGILEG